MPLYIPETCVDCACTNLDQLAVIFVIAMSCYYKLCKYTILHKRTLCTLTGLRLLHSIDIITRQLFVLFVLRLNIIYMKHHNSQLITNAFINMMTSPALHTRIVLGTGGELHSALSSAQRFILTYCMIGRVEFIWKGRKLVKVSLSASPNTTVCPR